MSEKVAISSHNPPPYWLVVVIGLGMVLMASVPENMVKILIRVCWGLFIIGLLILFWIEEEYYRKTNES